jgi:hypothetical protein
MHASPPDPFDYAALPPHSDFATLSHPGAYTPLPDNWCVGVADIQGSTKAIAAGRYKTVNMVAAAVISAQINAHDGAPFPFIFGGDGAGFAVPPGWATRAGDALAAVRVWAREAFDLELRVTLLTVADIRAAGQDVTVARFQAAPGVDYAMFSGGGLSWAEARMKAGESRLPEAAPGTEPDLTGLSCRWSHMPSRHGQILSLVVVPATFPPGPAYDALIRQIAALAAGLERAGTPLPAEGPGVSWPPAGARLEAQAMPARRSAAGRRAQVLFESFVAWVLIKTGLTLGGFDARRYRRVVGDNADFRKVEDGLKMTLDCDPATDAQFVAALEQGAAEGLIRYGLHRQDEAMMTCIVPSVQSDDHVHFVDGAAGGYTAAAAQIKG